MDCERDADVSAEPRVLASAADLAAIDLEAALGEIDRADDHALEQALGHAAEAAAQAGHEAAARAYGLLAILCTFHLRVEDPAEVYGPRWQSAEAEHQGATG